MNIAIWPNLKKKNAFQTAILVCQLLMKHQAVLWMEDCYQNQFSELPSIHYLPREQLMEHVDFAVAIGGDGTILRCAGAILGKKAKLVGINTGRLGYIAALEANELSLLEQLFTGDYSVSHRMMLQTTFQGGESDGVTYHALNDVYASRLSGKICDFSVFVDELLIGTYRADGIILSTPTGSSAYALSAGGPVMEPYLSLIEMNLICPHSLYARPMLFAPQRSIRVTYRVSDRGGLGVHVDGQSKVTIRQGQSFSVTRSPYTMPLVDFKGYAFYDALNGKLMQPLKSVSSDLLLQKE